MREDKLLGRESYLGIIEKRVSSLKDGYRQNIAIIGDELVGKTTLITGFLNKFCDTRIITAYLEIRPESTDSFIKRFIATLLYNLLINSGIGLKEDLDFLINKSERYIPGTVKKIRAILQANSKRSNKKMFFELMSLTESIKTETQKSCVIIFDEFHNLETLGFDNLYRDWSKIIIAQKDTMYIITSSMKFKTRAILSKNLSLLFGNFEVLNVEPFDIPSSEAYLEDRMQSLNISKSNKDFLVHFTGGYPFYLKVATEACLESRGRPLADIIEGLLFDTSGVLNQRFSNYVKRFMDLNRSNEYMPILYLVASGRNRIKEIAHIIKKPKKEVLQRISHLLELDALMRNGDFLRVNDRVFGFWLRFVYQEKLNSLTYDAKNQKASFRNKVEEMIEEFSMNSRKPVMERMVELLRLFEDETIQIDRKRVRLSHFREIKQLEFNSRTLKHGLIGRSSESLWLLAVKQGSLTENDIADFSRECKKYRHKLQRKIIISFQDIETNTRLKAMEEKVWTWDINNLNSIMDLFSKPRLIPCESA